MAQNKKIFLHQGDLPDDVIFEDSVAIDTETMGLNPIRDRLCLVQISAGDGVCHLVQFKPHEYEAPNLRKMLSDPDILKIFHFARFDIASLAAYTGIMCDNVYCTKIASKLVRTYTDKHGLKNICKEILNIDLAKQQQSSDWGAEELSAAQQNYAASDVLYLHRLKERLDMMLEREHRTEIAQECFTFLPTRAMLDLSGWPEMDIFSHR